MSKKTEKGMIVGLDIGTSKVVAIVGEVNDENIAQLQAELDARLAAMQAEVPAPPEDDLD